eukprot:1156288-Pelagomonas_calceolata.AAC.7
MLRRPGRECSWWDILFCPFVKRKSPLSGVKMCHAGRPGCRACWLPTQTRCFAHADGPGFKPGCKKTWLAAHAGRPGCRACWLPTQTRCFAHADGP